MSKLTFGGEAGMAFLYPVVVLEVEFTVAWKGLCMFLDPEEAKDKVERVWLVQKKMR